MKRPEQHEIDEQAQRIFKEAIPLAWVIREQKPDYGVDYLIEVVESQKLTGLVFGVQLKGTRSLRTGKGFVSYPLESEHLAYYLDKCRHSVFLVLVDVSRKRGYWIFLQGHNLGHVDWRKQGTVNIRIPATQTLDKLGKLCDAVGQADRLMAAMRPGALQTSMQAEKARMESLDPRFEVAITATDRKAHYMLKPRESVGVSFTLKTPPETARKIMDDLFGRGVPVRLDPDQIDVRGSPIIEYAFRKSIKLHMAQRTPAVVTLTCVDEEGREVFRVDPLQGKFEGGMTEQRLRAELPESPLRVGLTVTFGSDRISAGPVKINMSYKQWFGQPILSLPYFPMLKNFFNELSLSRHLIMEVTSRGNKLLRGSSKLEKLHPDRTLEMLGRSREVAQAFHINPCFPPDLCEEDIDMLDFLYDMATGLRRSGKGLIVTTGIADASMIQAALDAGEAFSDGMLALEREAGTAFFFREKIFLSPHVCCLSHARVINLEDVKRQVKHGGKVTLKWIGSDESEFWVERRTAVSQAKEEKSLGDEGPTCGTKIAASERVP